MTASALVTWRFTCRRRGCLAAAFIDGRPVTSARTLAISQDAAFAELAAAGWQAAGRGQLCPAHRRPVSLVKRQPAVVVPLPVKNMPRPGRATAAPGRLYGAGPGQPNGTAEVPEPRPRPAQEAAFRSASQSGAASVAGASPQVLPIGGTVRDGIAGMLPAAASRRERWTLFPRRNSGTASAHTRGGPAPMVRAQAAGKPGSEDTAARGSLPGRAETHALARPGPLARAVAWLRPGRWWPWRRKKGRHAAEFETHPVPAERWSA